MTTKKTMTKKEARWTDIILHLVFLADEIVWD